MKFSLFGRTLSACAAAALIAACGGSLPQTSTSRQLAQAVPASMLATHGKSWMDLGTQNQDLLYVSNGDGVVNVYRYWQQKLVGILTDFVYPTGECVNATGDVYIVDYKAEQIVEYAHGGKKPIDVLNDSPYSPFGCSVDLKSGDLAVANYGDGSYHGGNVAIWRHGTGNPEYFSNRYLYRYRSCAYDSKGNLLVTDGEYNSSGYGSGFGYLAKNSVKLITIGINGGSSWDGGFNGVRGIAWDGKYFVLNTYWLYRIVIKNGRGHSVGITNISGVGEESEIGPVWIYNNHHSGSQGTQVVAAWSNYQSENGVGYWKYPAGGNLIAEITKGLAEPYGVAVSLKQL